MRRGAKWTVLALLAATASAAYADRQGPRQADRQSARQSAQPSAQQSAQQSEGVLEAVDTQMRTVEIRNGGAREKIAFDETTEIVRDGEKLRPSKLGKGSRLRIDWTKRGPRIVATRIEVVPAAEPAG